MTNVQKLLLYSDLAETLYRQKKYPEAEKAVTEGLKLPGFSDAIRAELFSSLALVCILQAYVNKDKHLEAEIAITEGLKLAESNDTRAELYYLRALSCVNQGKYLDCEKAIAEGLALPDCPKFVKGKLYYVQSVAYTDQGKYLEAQKASAEIPLLIRD